MKQERLKELLQVAETEGIAAALKIARETGGRYGRTVK